MEKFQLTYTGAQVQALLDKVNNLVDLIYPVGSIYMSINSEANPATLFGGTWKALDGVSVGPSILYLPKDKIPVQTESTEHITTGSYEMMKVRWVNGNRPDENRLLIAETNGNLTGSSNTGSVGYPVGQSILPTNLWTQSTNTTYSHILYCWRRIA